MIATIALSALAALASGGTPVEPGEVEVLEARAAQAHEELMRGDIAAYRRTLELAPDFVLMDPFGGVPTGLPRSEQHWQRIGRFFREGSDATFQPIASYRSDDMIVLVANEGARVGVGALPVQDWWLRVTLVFREDAGAWRLVHRHADPLTKGITVEEAGRITLGKAP